MKRAMKRMVMAVAVLCMTAVVSQAQQATTSTETKTFEVIAVNGNVLVVRLPEGTRELTVADDFRFIVDGQPLSVRELKSGMKGTATITTRTTMTPVTVTEVRNGTVVERGGGTIVVRMPDSSVRRFSQADVDKRGITIVRDGRPAEVSDFREGDTLSATIITTRQPQVLTEREVQATLARATAAATPPAPRPATAAPAPAQAAPPAAAAPPAPAARTLPSTASSWPLLGLAGVLSLAMGFVLTARRRFSR
jgi:LPXTG-motif cell wall-anchored protein